MAKIFVCRCEDVTLHELEEAVARGHDDLESLKRYTGFGTGWCQGKSCVALCAKLLVERGGPATRADLAYRALLSSRRHWDARATSIPALLVGGIVNFAGNRHFAFRAERGSLARQAVGYTVVEGVALALNGLLYDLVLRTVP